MIAQHRRRKHQQAAPYGTLDFTAALVAREAALGIATSTQDVTQADHAPGVTFPVAVPADAGDTRLLPGNVPGSLRRDQWGNELLSGADADGVAHTIRSLWDGRTIRVCAEYRSGRHNAWWVFDEGEMRPVCSRCYPMAQGRR